MLELLELFPDAELFTSVYDPGPWPPQITQRPVHATFRQMYANLDTGFIVTLYEADSAAAVEQEFERVGFPFDSINEVDYALSASELTQLLSRG